MNGNINTFFAPPTQRLLQILQENEKYQEGHAEKLVQIRSPKLKTLDEQRNAKDMKTNVLNSTTAFGNMILSVCLLLVWSLVLSLKLCVPPSLWLNPTNLTITECQNNSWTEETLKTNGSVDFMNLYNSSNLVSSITAENPQFYLLNAITIGIIWPIGIASVIGCFPEKWSPKMQEFDQMISSNHSNLETLKASFVFLLALTLSLISAPIWINVSFIKTSCTSYIIWNLISYSLATANSMVIMMRLKIVQRLLRKCKTKIITKSISSPRNEHKYNSHYLKELARHLQH